MNTDEVKKSTIGIDNYRKELRKHSSKENKEFFEPNVKRVKRPMIMQVLQFAASQTQIY
jgi:type III secretory pathway component EscR